MSTLVTYSLGLIIGVLCMCKGIGVKSVVLGGFNDLRRGGLILVVVVSFGLVEKPCILLGTDLQFVLFKQSVQLPILQSHQPITHNTGRKQRPLLMITYLFIPSTLLTLAYCEVIIGQGSMITPLVDYLLLLLE